MNKYFSLLVFDLIRFPNRLLIGLMVITVSFSGSIALNAQNARSSCTIEVSKPGVVVADICRGQQLEDFNHQFQGGLYAQLIHNPSFEELRNPIAEWFLVKSESSNGNFYSCHIYRKQDC